MKRALLSLVLVAAVFSSFACERRGTGGTNDGGDTGAIKVGIYGDLSGQTSSFGQSTKNGALMAIDEINARGGINGRKIEYVIEDDQGQPAQAATVVSKLINQDKVHAILGENGNDIPQRLTGLRHQIGTDEGTAFVPADLAGNEYLPSTSRDAVGVAARTRPAPGL